MVVALLLLAPVSRRVDTFLLPLLVATRFRWAEINVREGLALALVRAGDVRGALRVHRKGVERGVGAGGFLLAVESASYGRSLLSAGWIGEGIEYLKVAARMTAGWPSNRLRDHVLTALATGHAFRGEEDETVAAVAAPPRASAHWQARLLALRAAAQLSEGGAAEAVATYGAALDAAHRAANRELVIVINNNLAGALIESGRDADAEACIAAAEALTPAVSPLRAYLVGTQAELALAGGDIGAAREALDRSEALKTQMGVVGGIGWTLATRARIEAAAGNRPAAERLLDQSEGILEDVGALRAWRSAALALGRSDAGIALAPPAPDPLLDRARGRERKVPERAWTIHRGIGIGLAMSLALPILWFAGRLQDRIPGGWATLNLVYALLLVLIFASIILGRVPRR